MTDIIQNLRLTLRHRGAHTTAVEAAIVEVERLIRGVRRLASEDAPRCHACACCEYTEDETRALLAALDAEEGENDAR